MINSPYVLFTRIHLVKAKSGRIFCDELWAKDLLLHLGYISNLRICCPVVYSDDVCELVDITDYGVNCFFELRKDNGFFSVLKNIIPNFIGVIKACKGARIVHSGGAGWAFPLSFYLLLIKPFFSFQWIVLIESSFWMLSKKEKRPIRKIIVHYMFSMLLSQCVKLADARIFTQSFYRKFFLKEVRERTLVAPASWVDQAVILSPEKVKKRVRARKGNTIEMLFPARLEVNKGVGVLFDAIESLKTINIPVNITLMGSGSMVQACQDFALMDFGKIKVIYMEPVRYGKDFFDIISEYDVVLVPNLKEEQPRIIFDAFSQGVCVIASDTTGISDITIDGENAVICKSGDYQSLADGIFYVANNPDILHEFGLNGLSHVRGKTHSKMHIERYQFLSEILNVD